MHILEKIFPHSLSLTVLTYLFDHEGEELYSAKIALALHRDVANVHRIIRQLIQCGVIREQRRGHRVHYALNKDQEFYVALKTLIVHGKNETMMSITEESRVNFLTLEIIYRGLNASDILAQGWGVSAFPYAFVEYENDYFHYYVPRRAWEEEGRAMIARLQRDQGIVDVIARKTAAIGTFVFQQRKKVEARGRNRMRAVQLFDALVQAGVNVCVFGFPMVLMETGTSQVSKIVETIIDNRRTLSKTTESLQKLTSELLSYPRETFTQMYRKAVLTGAFAIQRGKQRQKIIKKIVNDFVWINFGYKGPMLSESTVAVELDECLQKQHSALHEEYEGLDSTTKKLRVRRNYLARMIGLSHQERNLIDAVAYLSWLKLRRKDILFFLNYLLYNLIDPYRGTLSHEELGYLTLDEARLLIRDGRLVVSRSTLRERKRYCIYNTKEWLIMTGIEARRFAETHFEKQEITRSLHLLEGQTASFGDGAMVEGVAKIVRDERDIAKVEDGDILIAPVTIPSMVPAMKRAAAIVTDIGGITSHAAIVSRELNKPCVIGVRYATKVFKDGDRVIVCPRHAYITFRR